ncbi:PspC domain-containing protein [Streptomyces sp. MS06]|uniref:PspC domain-containing protein n=1 Tax=Streptomyces sp. MS06 TaxID=3385974 RepID=UPI00399FC4E4
MTDHHHAAAPGPGTPRGAGAAAGPGAATGPPGEPRAHAEPGGHRRPGSQAPAAEGAGAEGAGAEGSGAPGPGARSPGGAAPAEEATRPPGFRRERQGKLLAGVCSGLGRQCDMDPVIFRITLAVLSATGGIGLIFYGFTWLLVPYDGEREEENEVRKILTGRVDGQALTAVLFALVGCGVFLSMLNNGTVLTFAVVVSLLLAGAGYWSQRRGAPDPDLLSAQAAADAPPEAKAPPAPAAYPSWWRDPIVKDGTHVGGTGYLWGPQDSRDRDIAAAVNLSLTGHEGHGGRTSGEGAVGAAQAPPARAREPEPRGPRWIGGWVFLLALLAGGLGTGLTWQRHPLGSSLQTGLSCALLAFGLGIAFSAFLGRTGAGSVFLALVTAGLLAASTALPANIGTHWTRTTWRPATVAGVQDTYDLGTGVGTLDLSGLELGEGQTLATRAEVGVGRLRVVVPRDVTVRVSIDVGIGDIRLPGEESKDVDVAPDKHKRVTLPPADGAGTGAGTVALDLKVGVGQAEVSRAAS